MALSVAFAAPSYGQAGTGDPAGRAENPQGQPAIAPAQTEREAAEWAELEAQRRATDGDYDGAVQAHRQAEQDLQAAERLPLQQR